MPSEFRDAIAFFIFEALEEGVDCQPTIAEYVRVRVPWATDDDIVETGHHIVDVIARLQIEGGSSRQESCGGTVR